jgi:hypothetical protein
MTTTTTITTELAGAVQHNCGGRTTGTAIIREGKE